MQQLNACHDHGGRAGRKAETEDRTQAAIKAWILYSQ